MLDREGVLIERRADYGIIVEKSYTVDLLCDRLQQEPQIANLVKRLNPIWGANILYFDHNGKRVVVLSAKGAPTGANAVERIRRTGGRYIISIGTSGSTDESIEDGAFVLSTAAVRDEGVTRGYLDPRVPALSDPAMTTLLKEELEKLGVSPMLGVTFTTDKRYRENPVELRELYRTARVLNIDMETSAIILIASYYGIPVAAVNIVADCAVKPTNGDLKGVFDRNKDFASFVHPKLFLAFEASLSAFDRVHRAQQD